MPLILLGWLVQAATPNPTVVVRCEVSGDPQGRVYELRQSGEGNRDRWTLAMRSRKGGSSAVLLPLPDAKPTIDGAALALDYRTLNGGRDVRWTVAAAGAMLDVHVNFELEVNVEADLDPRVELMNTEGPIRTLSCVLDPK